MPSTYQQGGTKQKRRNNNSRYRGNSSAHDRNPRKFNLVRRFSGEHKPQKGKVLFALDTNILMKTPHALFGFHEHNILVTWQVLLELDNNKKGRSERAKNARHAINLLAYLLESVPVGRDLARGIPLVRPGENKKNAKKRGKLFFRVPKVDDVKSVLDNTNPDHRILLECIDRMVVNSSSENLVLVSKDRMMRIWALLVGVPVEDYGDDAIDIDNTRSTGVHKLNLVFWKKQGLAISCINCKSKYKLVGKELERVSVNEFLRINTNEGVDTLHMKVVKKISDTEVYAKKVVNYMDSKNKIFGINARNVEQNFALNALLDPSIKLVILEGSAGSGKTFLTLAAAYHQILRLKKSRYNSIVATREVAPVGREVGFMPGKESDKMKVWMGAVSDNVGQLVEINKDKAGYGKKKLQDVLFLKEMNSMRGRSFSNDVLMLDEGQNSTREQLKMFLTRVSDRCKTVVMGNFSQTDVVWTVRDSGLARLIDISRNSKFVAHIVLPGGERGGFCEFIETNL